MQSEKVVPFRRDSRKSAAYALVQAYRNIEAELGFVEGGYLLDLEGDDLESVVDAYLSRQEQYELLTCVRVLKRARPFSGSPFPLIAVTEVSVGQRTPESWDLDRIESVICKALEALAYPDLEQNQSSEGILEQIQRVDDQSRLICLRSSLLILAEEVTLFKMKVAQAIATPGTICA